MLICCAYNCTQGYDFFSNFTVSICLTPVHCEHLKLMQERLTIYELLKTKFSSRILRGQHEVLRFVIFYSLLSVNLAGVVMFCVARCSSKVVKSA